MLSHHVMKSAKSQRPNRQTTKTPRIRRHQLVAEVPLLATARRGEYRDRAAAPSDREAHDPSGWLIQPLQIIDGNQSRAHDGNLIEYREEAGGDGSGVWCRMILGATEQGSIERPTLRARQALHGLCSQPLEKVRQTDVRQAHLGCHRPTGKYDVTAV